MNRFLIFLIAMLPTFSCFSGDRVQVVLRSVSDQPILGGKVLVYSTAGELIESHWISSGEVEFPSPNEDFSLVFLADGHRPHAFAGTICPYVQDYHGYPVHDCSFENAEIYPAGWSGRIGSDLLPLPTVSGYLTDSSSGLPIEGGTACIFYNDPPRPFFSCDSSDAGGYYAIPFYPGIETYVAAETYWHYSELTDGTPCGDKLATPWPRECLDVIDGTGWFNSFREQTKDFELDRMARVTGRALYGVTEEPSSLFYIDVLDETLTNRTTRLQFKDIDLGEFEFPLAAGRYKLRIEDSNRAVYFRSLHDGLVCDGGCPDNGSTLSVTDGDVVDVGDVLLWPAVGVYGFVSSASDDSPLEGVHIDMWSAEGAYMESAVSGPNGSYFLASDCPYGASCDVLLSTANSQAFIDEVFNGVQCLDGPAFLGLCDLAAGTAQATRAYSFEENRADFRLQSAILFGDGFE